MRWGLFRAGLVWQLLVALALVLCIVSISSSPVAALSVDDYFSYDYGVEFSKLEILGDEVFNATITVTATCTNDLPLSVTEARITARVTAEHQTNGSKVTLKPSYTVTVSSFPNSKGETSSESVVVSLQFPEGSQSGAYSVVGELIEAEINTSLLGPLSVTSLLPESQALGSVTYTAPSGGGLVGGSGPVPPPTTEEVTASLFGTEVISSISASGEILETIEVTSEDGTLTMTISEGTIALDKDNSPLVSLEAEVDTNPPPPPEDANIIGLAYDFGPDDASFDPPITLTRSYDPSDIPEGVAEEDLVLAWYDETTGRWVELDCTIDTENNTITASIEHFTTFAIIGAATPAPEPESEVPAAVFHISELDIAPGEIDIGQAVAISVLITNTGNLEGTYQVTLEINNEVVETQEVTLIGGASDTVTFEVSENAASIYSVNVNGLSGSFVVKPVATPESESTPASSTTHASSTEPFNWPAICGVSAPMVAMGVLLFILARRRRNKSSS